MMMPYVVQRVFHLLESVTTGNAIGHGLALRKLQVIRFRVQDLVQYSSTLGQTVPGMLEEKKKPPHYYMNIVTE